MAARDPDNPHATEDALIAALVNHLVDPATGAFDDRAIAFIATATPDEIAGAIAEFARTQAIEHQQMFEAIEQQISRYDFGHNREPTSDQHRRIVELAELYYPLGQRAAELPRLINLAYDPARKELAPGELQVALWLGAELGHPVVRNPVIWTTQIQPGTGREITVPIGGGDFVDPTTQQPTIYDAVGGDPALTNYLYSQYVQNNPAVYEGWIRKFLEGIDDHHQRGKSVDIVVINVLDMPELDRAMVREYTITLAPEQLACIQVMEE